MMKIINIKKGALTVLAITALTFSCDDSFLEILPTASLGESQLLSQAGLEGTLIGAYSMLNGKGFGRPSGPNNWLGGVLGGVSNKGTDAGDYTAMNPIQRYEIDPTSGDANNIWRGLFEGVSRSNAVIRLAGESDQISDATRTRLTAEARVLRGHYYFSLKKFFNSAPYFDESVPNAEIPDVPNTSELWGPIEADFMFGMNNLPDTQSDAGRVNKWAAASYLAKAYVWQGKNGEARSLFDNIMANGQTTNGIKYALVPQFAQQFNAENDNHSEAIWAVQSANNTGSTANSNWFDDLNYPYNTGPDGPGNCCGFNQPTFTLGNQFRTMDGLPLLDDSYNDASNVLLHDYKVEAGDPFVEDAGPVDPRIDHTIGRRGIPYLDWIEHPGKAWIRDQTYAGPYSPKKFVYYKSQENSFTDGSSWTRGYAIMNVPIIRFGDVLLLAAEAELNGGSEAKAMMYINMVRARAADASGWVMEYDGSGPAANYQIEEYTAATFTEPMKALKFERVLELAQEGHRFYDLVRWGDAADFLNGHYLPHDSQFLVTMFGGASFTSGKSEYLPIPQAQIDIQPSLTQNPGY